MISQFKKHTDLNFSFLKSSKLLIAVSSGIDSVILVHLLNSLKYDISLAHCNFNLRGVESVKDEKFVENLATKLQLPHYSISFKTETYAQDKSISIQMAARELRYNWFEEILQQNKLDYVLTAHHKDDVLETFLINLTRGTGLAGLTGIPEINGNIVRPLLPFLRDEIEKYALLNSIKWREDKSNASTKYYRNKIRHDIIPVLKELNPNLMDSFQNTLVHLKGSQKIISKTTENISKDICSKLNGITRFDIKGIKKLTPLKPFLFELFSQYNFTEWNDLLALLDAQSGKHIFSKTHRLLKDRDFLLLSKIESDETSSFLIENLGGISNDKFSISFNADKSITNNNSICIDTSLLKFPLKLGTRKEGDFFYPNGMKGKKKVSKYFKDEKLNLIEKENTWILYNGDEQIIWILGKRQDRRFTPSSTTKSITNIAFHIK